MKLLDILMKAGSAAVKAFVPGGGIIIDVVNELLPEDKQLPNDATGADVRSAVDSLPAEQQAQLLNREFDIQIEEHKTVQMMLESEAKSQHTTRPMIAWWSFVVVAAISVAIVLCWGWAILEKDHTLVEKITSGWPFVAAIVGPFVTLLYSYFGILKAEQKNRLNAATGQAPLLHNVIKTVLKK